MTVAQGAPKSGSKWVTWLGVLIALGGPAAVVAVRQAGLIQGPLAMQRVAGCLALWALALAILAIVALGERRPLASIGLGRFTLGSLGWGVLAGVLAIMAFPACMAVLGALGVDSSFVLKQGAVLGTLPLWARLVTLATAGFCEEVLYRGYPIRRLRELTGSRLIAIVAPMAVFVALHAPSWGAAHLLYVSVVTVIMTVLFLWRGDLWSNIVAHLVTDAVPLFVMPMLSHH